MNVLDLSILGGILLVAGLPAIQWLIQKARVGLPKVSSQPGRAQIVNQLLSLESEISALPEPAEAQGLLRELIWAVLGGERGQ
jgi:hypothetical protein